MIRLLAVAAVLLAALSPRPSAATDGWTQIAAQGTTCWDGQPWHFYFRPGTASKLVVYFQGGGACWNAASCDPSRQPGFDLGIAPSDHALAHGLLDLRRADNPINEWNVAFLPYCTADMHIGANSTWYQRGDGSRFTFQHTGQTNTRVALDWIASRMIAQGVAPDTVLVTGESAGAIAAAYYGIDIGDRFPSAQLVVIGDGAGGYRSASVNDMLAAWGVLETLPRASAFADPGQVYFETFYVATNERHPGARLAQVNHADDRVQRRLLDLMGAPVEQLTKGLTCNLNEIRIDSPGFHSFIYPGDAHIMLRTDGLYTARCEGVALVDWIGDLLAGRPVVNHWCDGTAGSFADAHIPRL